MTAGRFRDRVVIERRGGADDGFGNPAPEWGAYMTVWANVRFTVGRERVAAGRLDGPRSATIRFRRGLLAEAITNEDRAVFERSAWSVVAVGFAGDKNQFVDLTVEEDLSYQE